MNFKLNIGYLRVIIANYFMSTKTFLDFVVIPFYSSLGLHPEVLRVYYGLCPRDHSQLTQETIWGLKLDQPFARQVL